MSSNHETETEPKPLLSNKAYDLLKPTTQIVLPGLGALYFALAQIWGFPKAEEIVGTIAAVNVFLGLLLGLSSRIYNNIPETYDGTISSPGVDPDTGIPDLRLNVTTSPDDLAKADVARFKVEPPPDH